MNFMHVNELYDHMHVNELYELYDHMHVNELYDQCVMDITLIVVLLVRVTPKVHLESGV